MKALVVVRHGEYIGERLSNLGRQQMDRLGQKLFSLYEGKKILMFNSTAPRGQDSADVLASILNITSDPVPVLWSDNRHPVHMDAVLKLIEDKRDQADVLILVTHLEYVNFLPGQIAEKEFGTDLFDKCEKGEALIIDFGSQQLTRITR